jgi:prepilin-type processing-associated H-X9-DG protein
MLRRKQEILFSLAMNSQLIQPPNPTIHYSLIENAGVSTDKIVLFLDNLLDDETKVHPLQARDHLGQPSSMANRFGGRRHHSGGNLAFADGHVQWLPGNKVVETDPSKPLRGGKIVPAKDIVWDPTAPGSYVYTD